MQAAGEVVEKTGISKIQRIKLMGYKFGLGTDYYVPPRKRRICESTVATSGMLGIICEENPTFTINEIKELLLDETKYIYMPEAIYVLDKHIEKGYGDRIPGWKY